MIKVTFYKDSSDQFKGFDCIGHAGFGEYGYDIVCASVSTLVINAINSIEQLTDDAMSYEADENSGSLIFRLNGETSKESEVLLESLYLGIETIKVDHENYITLKTKEV